MRKYILPLIAFFLIHCASTINISFAQTGPGGVGSSSNINAWLDASSLGLSNAASLSSWTDISGNNNAAVQLTGSNQPTFFTNQLNGLPAIVFDGTNDILGFTNNITSSALTSFIVYEKTNTAFSSVLQLQKHHFVSSSSNFTAAYNGSNFSITKANNSFSIGSVTTTSDLTNGSSTITNNDAVSTFTRPSFRNSSNSSIGGFNSNFHHQGSIAEVIVFNQALNSAKRKIVSNYLAAKYNLTAEQNLYAFKTSHGSEVIGIGQEADGNHTVARGSGNLELSNRPSLDNGEYVLIGNDAGGFTTSNSVGVDIIERWTQVWRADVTGTPGTVDLTFFLGTDDFASNPANYVVLVENVDGDFSNGGTSIQESGRLYDAINKTITFTGISFTSGDYFTLAEKVLAVVPATVSFGPGGVGNSANIEAWMDATRLSLSNNDPVSTWADFSGNNNDALQSIPANQPTFLTNQINNLPAISFDGVTDLLEFNSNITTGALTSFIVYSKTNTSFSSVLQMNKHHLVSPSSNFRASYNGNNFSVAKSNNSFSVSSLSTTSDLTNGSSIITNNNSTSTFLRPSFRNSSSSTIGSFNSSFYHQGAIAEIVIFNEALNSAKRKIVSNHLAAKYNLTAEQNLYSFKSTHGSEVIGLGQEADGNHIESRGLDSLKISNPSALDNGDYILVGADGNGFATSTSVGPDAQRRWTQVWRADVTGTPGDIDLTFYLGGNDFAADPNNYAILIENIDGNFTNGGTSTQETGRVYDAVNGTVTFTGITLADGDYFTLAERSGLVTSVANGIWANPTTWSCNCVPLSTSDVTIGASFSVTIDELANAKSLTIGSTGTLIFGGNDTLQLLENLTINGTLISGTGTLLSNGSSAQNFSNTSGTNVELSNLVIDNPTSVLLTGGWSLNNNLQVNAGALNVTGADSLVLLSTASKTAQILESAGSFVGNFTLQRFISSRNANFANISAPTSNATVASIDDDLKLSGVNGNNGNAVTTNFVNIFYSMYSYDRSNGNALDTITSTATPLSPGVGYEVYLFNTLTTMNDTTIDYVGTPNFGAVTPPNIINGFNLVGNPYQSFIAFSDLDLSNIAPSYYVYETNTGSYGLYGVGDIIAPGQGFWVDNLFGTVPFNFDESQKTSSNSSAFLRQKRDTKFTMELSNNVNYFKNTIEIGFDYSATDGIDQFDARFLPSPHKNSSELYTKTISSDKLVKNILNQLEDSHVVPLEVKIGEAGTYKIESNNLNSILDDYSCVYLNDKATNTSIDLSVEENYSFQAEPGISNRFNLIVSNSFEDCDKAINADLSAQKIDDKLNLRESYGNWYLDYKLESNSQRFTIAVYGLNGQLVLPKTEVNLSENGTYQLSELNSLNGIFVIQILGEEEVINKTIKL